ncbi:hypothetical protein CCACVL1_03802 [Corchorus capsularis]|uniref:Uncharacterized protein n=1 Tax=Corchorus capsularis TaxID=210143 RepID=A0A1R3JXB8_COCAP|nr:hypothetical protein CCACVL1_03802 [Corchorus capsularis]
MAQKSPNFDRSRQGYRAELPFRPAHGSGRAGL